MDQFIREVDEEYRREQIAQIWKRFGGVIVAVAVLIVAGVGGWRYWQHAEQGRAEQAALRFDDAVRLSREGKGGESEAMLATLAAEAPAGYRLLARFRAAAELGQSDAEKGAAAYDALAQDSSVSALMQDLARLRGAILRLDRGDPAVVERDLERLSSPTNPWRHTAREMLGVSALKRGDFDKASRWFDEIARDREAPANLKQRLEIYTALAAGGPVQTR